jgi:iron(III) transport system permease protein
MANYGLGSGYAVFNLIIAGGFIYAYYLQVRKENRFAVVTGKAYRPRPVELRKRWCYIFYAAIALYILLAVIAPFWVLLSASLGILYTPFSFGLATLQYYRDAFALPDLWRSTWNTLVISSVAATVCMLIALVTSWLAIRGKYRGSTLPSNLTFLVHAVPSIVIGLAFIIIYTRIPIPIYGTIWIIALAYVTRYMGFSVRLLYSPYLQLHSELEEASGTCGVGWLSTMRHIVMPILWPSFIKGWLWVFITCIRDVGLALMLFVVSNDTIGIRLWQIWGTGRHFEWGAALAMPLLVFSIFLSFFIARPSLKGGEVI